MRIGKSARRKRVILLASLVAVTVAAAVYAALPESGDAPAFVGGGGSFTVTAELDGGDASSLPPLLDTLDTAGIKAAFFMTPDYIESNKDTVSSLLSGGHTACLLVTGGEGMSRGSLMRLIAAENDRFFALTGRYPSFARVRGGGSTANDILDSYGITPADASAVLTEAGCGEGDVISICDISAKTADMLARVVARREAAGEKAVTLTELLG